MKRKKTFEYVRIVLYVTTIMIIILASVGIIDIKCFWKENYNLTCPSCGITRASRSILTLNFKDACGFNAYYTLVFVPLIFILFVNDVYVIFKRQITKKDDISLVEILLGYGEKNNDKNNTNS